MAHRRHEQDRQPPLPLHIITGIYSIGRRPLGFAPTLLFPSNLDPDLTPCPQPPLQD